ncbi:MAG: tetratricopeptide repeat protein, partial [bacterium]|nr:tetratricopeptide repeat protein [bacterium]
MVTYNLDKIGWNYSMRMGCKCACKGDYEDSIKYYEEALREGTKDGFIYNNLADAYMNVGRPDIALEYAKEAIGRLQDETFPYVTLGEVHQANGEHGKAVDCIVKAQEIFEESVPELKGMIFDS